MEETILQALSPLLRGLWRGQRLNRPWAAGQPALDHKKQGKYHDRAQFWLWEGTSFGRIMLSPAGWWKIILSDRMCHPTVACGGFVPTEQGKLGQAAEQKSHCLENWKSPHGRSWVGNCGTAICLHSSTGTPAMSQTLGGCVGVGKIGLAGSGSGHKAQLWQHLSGLSLQEEHSYPKPHIHDFRGISGTS